MSVRSYNRVKENLADNILKDCKITLTGPKTKKLYDKPLRMVECYDAEDKRMFTYLTNSNKISASRVAELYKNRWLVELFFKWLKQHLKIKKFWGTSENSVKIQIYVAIITYCLIAIVHHDMKLTPPVRNSPDSGNFSFYVKFLEDTSVSRCYIEIHEV